MKIIVLLSFLLIPSLVLAEQVAAVLVRGKVLSAQKVVSVGDTFNEGEAISTSNKSVVRLRFESGALLTLGPNTKIIINELRAGETKLFSLVNGYLRGKFSKDKSDEHKILIKTPTAALGVRGTEFNLTYNNQNNVSSALALQGTVEFSSRVDSDSGLANDRVDISAGKFSSTFSQDDAVIRPVKISPQQFAALKRNSSFKVRDRKEQKVTDGQQLISGSEGEQSVPSELIGSEYEHAKENYRDDVRPGGYIDLVTGLYISPPEDAIYNEEQDVFEVPKELGGFDPDTGEYIPPLGLILHPLKGFVLASTMIESGVYYVREKATDAISMATTASKKLVKGVETFGRTLEQNTGKVGETTGKTLRYLGRTTKDAANKTGEIVHKRGLLTLNEGIEKMNHYLYYGALRHIETVKNKLPLISQFDLKVSDRLTYSTLQRDMTYRQVDQIISSPSFSNDFQFSSQYYKSMWDKIFIRPKFQFDKKNYFRDHLHPLNWYRYGVGFDVGTMGKFKGNTIQAYFHSNFAYSYKGEDFNPYIRDRQFGFTKLLIGKEYMTSKFDYTYTQYHLRDKYHGRMHLLSLSEIINLDNKNYFNLGINWSTRQREEYKRSISIYGGRLEYFISHRQHRFTFSSWVDYKIIDDQLNRGIRGVEQNFDLGLKLNKNFPKLFSTSLEYKLEKLYSDSIFFDKTGHSFVAGINVSY